MCFAFLFGFGVSSAERFWLAQVRDLMNSEIYLICSIISFNSAVLTRYGYMKFIDRQKKRLPEGSLFCIIPIKDYLVTTNLRLKVSPLSVTNFTL